MLTRKSRSPFPICLIISVSEEAIYKLFPCILLQIFILFFYPSNSGNKDMLALLESKNISRFIFIFQKKITFWILDRNDLLG